MEASWLHPRNELVATAAALTFSRPLGPLVPMPDAALEELRKALGVN